IVGAVQIIISGHKKSVHTTLYRHSQNRLYVGDGSSGSVMAMKFRDFIIPGLNENRADHFPCFIMDVLDVQIPGMHRYAVFQQMLILIRFLINREKIFLSEENQRNILLSQISDQFIIEPSHELQNL